MDRGACIRKFKDLLTHIFAICIYIHVICLPKSQSLTNVTVECGVKSKKYITSIKNEKCTVQVIISILDKIFSCYIVI
jgi:hypothetical protein